MLTIALTDAAGFRGMTAPEWSHIEISRQLVGQNALLTIAHEIFHRVQYAYLPQTRAQRGMDFADFWTLILEGGARFSEDLVLDGANRYGFDAERWFTSRRRPLVRSQGDDGALGGATYEAALFWKYVAEQIGEECGSVRQRQDRAARSEEREQSGSRAEFDADRDWGGFRREVYVEAASHQVMLETARTEMGRNASLELTARVLRESNRPAIGDPLNVRLFDRLLPLSAPVEAPGRRSAPPVPLVDDAIWPDYLCAVAMNGQSTDDRRFEFKEQPAFRGAGRFAIEVPRGQTILFTSLPVGPGSGAESADPNAGAGTYELGFDWASERRVHRLVDNIVRGALRIVPGTERRPLLPYTAPMLKPYDMTIHKVDMRGAEGTNLLHVEWEHDLRQQTGDPSPNSSTALPPLLQIVLLGPGGKLVDVIRHDPSLEKNPRRYTRTIACRGVVEVLLMSCSRDSSANVTVWLSRRQNHGVFFATSWNCPRGRSLTHDPTDREWDWMSPDLELIDEVGRNSTTGRIEQRKVLRLAVTNLGDHRGDAEGDVAFFFRPWRAGHSVGWTPLGEPVRITRLESHDWLQREVMAGRTSEDIRNGYRRFVIAPWTEPPPSKDAPVILRAEIRHRFRDPDERPLVVLGSSNPISREDIEVADGEGHGWSYGKGSGAPKVCSASVSARAPTSATFGPTNRTRQPQTR